MTKYNFKEIEESSQKFWKENNTFKTSDDQSKDKYYVLDMFPYPSAQGLHVGHIKGYFATDAIAHYKRLNGYNVLHPMGWDAFGLPAENYAIKVKKKPSEITQENAQNFKKQMNLLGLSYDWDREIYTTDPNYYKWTQWIFLKLFEKGLAYEAEIPINFCPSCKTGLANEEVVSGKCDRCHTDVKRKKIRQWILRITKYADKLLEELDVLDWPEPIKEMQRNWIGRSEGSEVVFKINNSDDQIKVYTTRIDTLYGCTYVVLAPEHDLVDKITTKENKALVNSYLEKIANKSDLDRQSIEKEKTGVFTGAYATNPINGESIPIWISDYVLASYGTGAVMAVPAHDNRDYEFAKIFNLPISYVIAKEQSPTDESVAFIDYGILQNSSEFDGLSSEEAKVKITEKLIDQKLASFKVNYKLRDWVFSRQRYWGEPIPIVHCEECGLVAVPMSELPVKLPEVDDYEPSGTGDSPLANIEEWVNTKCPTCGGNAKRETNTMPQWAGSCWYYLRFINPKNDQEIVSKELENYFMPVDWYVGGAEHAVLHLLYARFWHRFLYDEHVLSTKEPFLKLNNVGMILGPDHQKMSKSRGNVINPDDLVSKQGADALRLYTLFIGPFDQPAVWAVNGITGTKKLLEKIFDSFENRSTKKVDQKAKISNLILSVSQKIESMSFNTIISDFMKFSNEVDLRSMTDENYKTFLILLAPFAPHICEYLFRSFSSDSIFRQSWPTAEEVIDENALYIVQINGKKRASFQASSSMNEEEVVMRARDIEPIKDQIAGKAIKKTIFVNNKLINFVI